MLTGGRRAERRAGRFGASAADASVAAMVDAMVDAVAVIALTLVGMTALAQTFDGWTFLVAAAGGAFLGVLSAAVVVARRWPWPTVVAPLIFAVLLCGPVVVLRNTQIGSLPGVAATEELGRLLLDGWKDLLTTLPPLDGSGPLSSVPFYLSLASGASGFLAARRSWRPFLPLLGPLLAAGGAILLGLIDVGGAAGRALCAIALGVLWGASRRRRIAVTGLGDSPRRVVAGAALLIGTGVVVVAVAPILAPAAPRTVLRERVVSPVDVSDYRSPLAGFRRYRPAAQDLADRTLLTITGLPAGTAVRLATVDRYVGTVWAAGDGRPSGSDTSVDTTRFLRVGARIPVDIPGRSVSASVTIGEAFADAPDLQVWLPDVGLTTRIAFAGSTAPQREADLRYNPVTGAALVLSGLAPGDTYRLDAVLPDVTVPARPGALGPPSAPSGYSAVAAKYIALVAPAGSSPIDQVRAVAARMRSTGAYTDGAGAEATFLPGHSLGRLTTFLGEGELAGNDEQYAATLALAASYSGLPSRVVLGAVPGSDGVIRGRDVRAWVEVQVDSRSWWTILPEEFVPPRDRKPTPRPATDEDRTDAAVVPPPNALRPPSSLEGFALDNSSSGRIRQQVDAEIWVLPAWVSLVAKVAGIPLGAVLGWTLLLVGAKAVRRSRRRRSGTPDQRVAAAWTEVVDSLADAGGDVSPLQTRSEVARHVDGLGLAEVAVTVDRLAFGPMTATDADAIDVWAQARRVRAQLAATLRWRDRWRAAVSLRSVRGASGAAPVITPSGLHQGRIASGQPRVDPSIATGVS